MFEYSNKVGKCLNIPESMKQTKIFFQIVCATKYPNVLRLSIFNWYGVVNRGWIAIQALQSVSCTLLNKMNVSDLILNFLSHVMKIQNTFMDLKRKISGAF